MEAVADSKQASALNQRTSIGESRARAGSDDPALRHPALILLLATAVWALALISYSSPGDGAIAAFIAVVLVIVAATDLERRIIPNRVVVPAIVIILIARAAMTPARLPTFVLAALGAGTAFLVPNLINRSLMGMGDVKLAVFLGAGLGLSVVGAVTVAFIAVFPFALAVLVRGGRAARKSTLPFGPFLAFGALVILIVPRLLGVAGA